MTPVDDRPVDLSVVVITRNEESTIGRCVESILAAVSGLSAEVVVVDSDSSDRTREVAGRYPVRVEHLPGSLPLSASAGRFAGTCRSRGEFLFFVDGDMVVAPEWVRTGLAAFADSRLAGVAGPFYWVYPGEDLHLGNPDRRPVGSVETLSGTGIYRRSALEKAGTFNPWMVGEEERELGYRLRMSGYTLLRLEIPMAFHVVKSFERGEADEKARHHIGIGQILRAYPFRAVSCDLIRSHRRPLLEELLIGMLFLTVVLLLLSGLPLLGGAVLGACALAIALLVWKKGWRKTALYLRVRVLSLGFTLRGILRGVPRADSYPLPAP